MAEHYRVPLWSYAEGVGEALTGHMPEPFWKEGDAGWKHPNWETHALFADVVATALQTAEWQAGCVSPVSDQLGSVPRARDGSSAGAEHGTQAVSTERPGLPDRVQETTLVCMQESSGTEGLLAALSVRDGQVIPTLSHFLEHISPIFPPFPPAFCAFSPSRRGGSNEPQAGTQGQETVGKTRGALRSRPSAPMG